MNITFQGIKPAPAEEVQRTFDQLEHFRRRISGYFYRCEDLLLLYTDLMPLLDKSVIGQRHTHDYASLLESIVGRKYKPHKQQFTQRYRAKVQETMHEFRQLIDMQFVIAPDLLKQGSCKQLRWRQAYQEWVACWVTALCESTQSGKRT